MTAPELQELLVRLPYKHDVRELPDKRRCGQFCTGWQDATVRGKVYTAAILASLTWRNLGYRLGQSFGPQSPEQIAWAYQVLAELYAHPNVVTDWRVEVRQGLTSHQETSPELADRVIECFERAFEHTRCPEHAWFGVQKTRVSLVVGGVFLAAVVWTGSDCGFWLLVDQQLPIDGVEYHPVVTKRPFSLFWAHASALSVLPHVVAHPWVWASYAVASEQIRQASPRASDRNELQKQRGKKRLSDLLKQEPHMLDRALLTEQEQQLTAAGAFDPDSIQDGRERTWASIVRRYGQPAFRRQLLQAYTGKCAISGCNVAAVLDAAHIIPYKGSETNHPANGLLLRTDLHTLFDLGLVAIDTETMCVLIAPSLVGTCYEQFSGKRLCLPSDPLRHPSRAALDEHRAAGHIPKRVL